MVVDISDFDKEFGEKSNFQHSKDSFISPSILRINTISLLKGDKNKTTHRVASRKVVIF